jgi:hypothetical protein
MLPSNKMDASVSSASAMYRRDSRFPIDLIFFAPVECDLPRLCFFGDCDLGACFELVEALL